MEKEIKMKISKIVVASFLGMALIAFTLPVKADDYSAKTKAVAAESEMKDIVETAVSAGSFNTLVTAVKAAGLVETLKGKGPFTVFAPTDSAFAKLPAGTVESLLKNKEKLASILTYHVVAGKVMAADVVKLTSAKTVNGQSLTIKADKSGVMVDNAKVIMTDIVCSNGIIHVIDTVVIPKEKK
jgi:transforming growth factor-beta-induced protein